MEAVVVDLKKIYIHSSNLIYRIKILFVDYYLGGWVVVVVSLPMLALPLSDEALQLPELEWG